VGWGTGTGRSEAPKGGRVHVGLVIWGVEVYAVPAGGEVVDC
jgi:hypothetical protein